MNFLDLCNQRFSARSYTDQAVEKDKLDYILKAAQLAPSAVNFQPWVFLVVQEEEGRTKLLETYRRDWFKTAPCYIVICADHNLSWKRKIDEKDFADVDAAIAIEHIALAATDCGLASCWVCNFEPELLKTNFNIPAHLEPIAILPIGYTDEVTKDKNEKRKPLSEIIKWEKF